MARQIVVDIVGDSSKFSRATSGAVSSAEGLTGKLQGIGKGMVVGAGIASFNLLQQGIGAVIGSLGAMDQAFKDDQASQVLLNQALQNNIVAWDGNSKGVEKYATAQAKLGFTDDEVRTSIGQLIGVTHDLSRAQELNTLAQDLARAKGIDLAQATDIVTKAQQGNGKALKALGIDIAGATSAADLMDRIQQNVRGSAEAWAATSEGKTAVSQVKVGEAMEKIGGIIDKVAQVVMPALADAFTFVADVVANVFPYIEGTIKALQPVFQAIGIVAGVVFKGIGIALGVVVEGFKIGFGIVGGVIDVLGNVFRGIGTIVSTVFGAIGGVIKGAINFVIDIINGVIGAINAIQVHIHVGPVNLDWYGLRIGRIPKLHSGGIVPGQPGADVLTMLQAGERVTPAGSSGVGGSTVINFNFPQAQVIDGPALDRFARDIAQRLTLVGIT